MKILSGTSNQKLSKDISKQLKLKLVNTNIKRFADGEIYIEINENLYYDDFVTAVMHEMVHVKQDYRKDKRPIEQREKEAYEQQEILFERWKDDN